VRRGYSAGASFGWDHSKPGHALHDPAGERPGSRDATFPPRAPHNSPRARPRASTRGDAACRGTRSRAGMPQVIASWRPSGSSGSPGRGSSVPTVMPPTLVMARRRCPEAGALNRAHRPGRDLRLWSRRPAGVRLATSRAPNLGTRYGRPLTVLESTYSPPPRSSGGAAATGRRLWQGRRFRPGSHTGRNSGVRPRLC
jgi:hypothetical protein